MAEAGKPWRLRRESNNNKMVQRPRGNSRAGVRVGRLAGIAGGPLAGGRVEGVGMDT